MVKKISPDNLLIAFDGDDNIKSLISTGSCRIEHYGIRVTLSGNSVMLKLNRHGLFSKC